MGGSGHPWTRGASSRGRLVYHAADSGLVPGKSSDRNILSDDRFHFSWEMATASNACQCQPGLWVVPVACRGGRVSAFWIVGPGDGGRADCKHGYVSGTVQPLALFAAWYFPFLCSYRSFLPPKRKRS